MIDDIEVTKALLDAVTAWNKSKGMDNLIGPIGFTDLDRMGMLVEGFEYLNMFITIWNPKYYHDHLEQLGPDFNTFNSVKPIKWLNIAKRSVFDLLSIVF